MTRLPLSELGDSRADRVMGHRPEVLAAWEGLKHALVGESSTLSPELREQVRRTLALRTGCEFCASLGRPAAEQPSPRDSLAVAFAEAVATDHTAITDGQLEVLLEAEDRKIYGWNHNGTELAGFPLTTGGEIRGAVSLFDVDGDGRMEAVVVGNDRQVVMWDLPGEMRVDRMPWPFFRHDSRNTGRYGAEVVATGVPDSDPVLPPSAAPPVLAFLGASPNPFAATTRLRFSVASPDGAGERGDALTRLRVFDVAGRVVATLIDRPLAPGMHEVQWDGHGMRGEAPSGVYFVRLEQGGNERQGRILRLR